jgi:SAM-dependent methyltransferase
VTAHLGEALGLSAAVEAAGDLGMLDQLAQGPATAEELSANGRLAPRMVTLLLDALCTAGAVARVDDRYEALTDPADLALERRLWSGLAGAVRDGRPVLDVTDPIAVAACYPVVLARSTAHVAPAVAALTAALAGRGPEVLDLGAGACPWSRALAQADAEIRVTAVELPGVAAITRRSIADHGLGDRFRVVEGDLFRAEVGTGFDLVLIAGVCRLFGPTANALLARRAAALVRPGGEVAIVDALPDADRSDGRSNALYALGLALRTSTGGVHHLSAYASWLYDAGLAGIELVELDRPELSLVRATRPA